ncbi:type I polyketide synthase [Micromonospora fulviviridis]|uniref:type I polyketide synthase n=1 Tax=Micromonospora fulviviridis TaxID=47860 RepID=UPI0037AAB783
MTSFEPIAIVGMACRFAGNVSSPEEFWALLRDGRDTVGELPEGRWAWYARRDPEHAEAVAAATRRGSFLPDIAGFDADFFEITPREAALMDPQQRLILELSWEALEHAGIPPRGLAGSDAGVFMGVGADDYGRRLLEDLPRIEAWTGIGSAYCAVANRVSYTLDLHGPSMTVDTACSSSLVAVHLASQALRAGECDLALAGGVLVMAAPGLTLVLDAAGATAPDGRCKSFDSAADGYGRGEGGGVLVLRRLSDAQRAGDRILAVIRGSAVMQDGRTNGIMAPNGHAQAALMRRACREAGVAPQTVDYVEAHGTGTPVGDPLEAGALASVFGAGRPLDRPLLIGSVKPNVGHLEAGAGVAGIIKTVLAMAHRELPPSLHLHHPNPTIDWQNSGLRVVTERTPWPITDAPPLAAVSGYGYGGTIAHVILTAPEGATPPPPAPQTNEPRLYPLSGASEAAVRDTAQRVADLLSSDTAPATVDVGHTLARRRSHLARRAAVVATGPADLARRLRDYAAAGRGCATGAPPSGPDQAVVWVFSGHGSQWTGMAHDMLASSPEFAAVIDRLEPIFQRELQLSPRAALADDQPQPVDVIQPMIFAVQVALAAAWRAVGLRPAAVIGHSVGEIAAAVTAGMLTLEQGARLVCHRSVLLGRVAGAGAMAMVNVDAQEAARQLDGRHDVVVAISSSPHWSVLSGDITAVAEVKAQWRAEGRTVREIDSDVAFHSPHMDPLLEPLTAALADLRPAEPDLPVYSTALPDPRTPARRDAAYWAANLREPVRLAEAVTAAADDGYRLFLEVSPHPVVAHSVADTLDALGIDGAHVAYSLRRRRPGQDSLLTNLGELWCHGAAVDWPLTWPDGTLTDLPTPAWQRRRHWASEPSVIDRAPRQHDRRSHTLLGERAAVRGAVSADVWSTRLDRTARPYPGDHPVRGVEIVPAAVLLNTFLTAAAGRGLMDLTDVTLRAPVSLTRPCEVQVVLQGGALRLSSRLLDDESTTDDGWLTHTVATLDAHAGLPDTTSPRHEFTQALDPGFVVDRLATLGVAAMGFPWTVQQLGRTPDGLVAEVSTGTPSGGWAPVLDAALSIASVVFPGPPVLRMPAGIRRITLAPTGPAEFRVVVHRTADTTVDVEIVNGYDEVVGMVTGLRYGLLDLDAALVRSPMSLVHAIGWLPAPARPPRRPTAAVTVGPYSALAGELAAWLDVLGVPRRHVTDPAGLTVDELTEGHSVVVVPAHPRGGDEAATVTDNTWLLARTAQRLAAARPDRPARLWCLTRGVRDGGDSRALAHAALWGMGRVIASEHREFWGGLVDVGSAPQDLGTVVDLIGGAHEDDLIAVRDGVVSVPRLHTVGGALARPPLTCRPDGTYLVTGGLGALGLEVASWLATCGARRIVLTGRRGLPGRDAWDRVVDPGQRAAIEAIRRLEGAGVTVVVVALDVADHDAAARLLTPSALGLPAVRGVVHAAGVLDDRTVRRLDEASLRHVLRPKVAGALSLHTLFPPGSVDFFVLFSSAGQLLGLPGQASYAAGNAFLDGLARLRRAAGDTGTRSMLWTSWRGLGMSTSSAVIDAELAARGTGDVTATEAFASWQVAHRYDIGEAVVLRLLAEASAARRPAMLAELTTDRPADTAASPAPAWVGLDGAALRSHLAARIGELVAEETGLAEVDPRRPLVEMGLDSVMTTRVRYALESDLDLPLPPTLLWDQPTVEAIAEHLATRMTSGGDVR